MQNHGIALSRRGALAFTRVESVREPQLAARHDRNGTRRVEIDPARQKKSEKVCGKCPQNASGAHYISEGSKFALAHLNALAWSQSQNPSTSLVRSFLRHPARPI